MTTSAPLQIAKAVKKSPLMIATLLAKELSSVEGVEKAEAAAPGFVNVTLKAPILFASLDVVLDACEAKPVRQGEAPVIVEYSQPNIAKPLGIHHILSTIIGQSLTNIYRHLGKNVIAINHIGDWGTQFGKLAVAFERWSEKPIEKHSLDELLTLYVRFHEEVERNAELEEEGRAAFAKLEKGDVALRSFQKAVVDITMDSMKEIYHRLHVSFDYVQGESFYEDKMQPVIDEGKQKKVFTAGRDGALIVDFPEEMKIPPAIVLKSDGSTIYLTRDLATIRYRIDTWHPSSIVYVVDIAQQLYFKQLFEAVRMLGWELPTLEHIHFGRMRFSDRSMSTRKGNILKLSDVLDEAVKRSKKIIDERGEKIQTDDPQGLAEMMGIGAVVYGVLSQNRKMDMVFDWDKMLTFEGNSAPYLQYTHARARSVLRKADMLSADLPIAKELTPKERILVKLLLNFSAVLDTARSEHLPHKLTTYLYEVCQAYNSFYNTDEILTAAEPVRSLRLGLTSLTAQVLKTGAELLTLRVPERM